MLAVQVQYWDLQERKRHNQVTERQGDRSLNLQSANLEELKRHNIATESISWATLGETQRHNLATEDIQKQTNVISMYRADTDRLNAQTNMRNAATNAAMIPIQWFNAESTRMNVENANWYNQQRVNLDLENQNIARFKAINEASIGSSNVAVAGQNADTNYMNAQTNQQRNEIQQQYNEANISYLYDRLNWETEQRKKDRQIDMLNWLNNVWRNLNGTKSKQTEDEG